MKQKKSGLLWSPLGEETHQDVLGDTEKSQVPSDKHSNQSPHMRKTHIPRDRVCGEQHVFVLERGFAPAAFTVRRVLS